MQQNDMWDISLAVRVRTGTFWEKTAQRCYPPANLPTSKNTVCKSCPSGVDRARQTITLLGLLVRTGTCQNKLKNGGLTILPPSQTATADQDSGKKNVPH